jgi:glycosyltransferase involved in cell wall biosynthesis
MSKKIDAFYAVSVAAVNWIVENLKVNPKRITFIPLAADSNLFKYSQNSRDQIRKKLGIHQTDVVLIFSGKFANDKKVDVLLKTVAPLLRLHSNFKVLLLGSCSPAYLKYLKQIITEEEIGNNVVIHPFVHRLDLPAFYSAADFAVWPCGMSISIIEAMSNSLPIIIARLEWTSHLLENSNGFDFTEGNISELRNCIKILFESPELRRTMGSNGRKLVEEKLSWANIERRFLQLYSAVMNP